MENWQNPAIMNENQLPSKVYFDEDHLSLNGKWRFQNFCDNDPLPEEFYAPALDDRDWNRIMVPGCVETVGAAEPWLCNGDLPPALSSRSKNAPELDRKSNSVYLYRRSFKLPEEWQSGKIIIRFHDVRNQFRFWINGVYIGMTKGCGLNAEFEITKALKPGKNKICVQLWQFSDTSYLAPENGWLMSGLMGDVEIYQLPDHRILNMRIKANYSDDCTSADLAIRIYTENADGYVARIAVMDGSKVCFYGEGIVEKGKATAHISCKNMKLWSHEDPYLYKIAVILWDGKNICHTRQIRYGFRTVNIVNSRLTVNGKPVFLQGVNYLPFHPDTGLTVDEEIIRQDLKELKKLRINSIRTGNGPVSQIVYALCDEYGLYVIDGFSTSTTRTDHQIWTDCSCQWTDRLVRSHRNHPSVIIWSVTGQAERDAVLTLDDSRPVICDSRIGYTHSNFCTVKFPSQEQISALSANSDFAARDKGAMRFLSGSRQVSLLAEEYGHLPLLITDSFRFTGNGAPDLSTYMQMIRSNTRWAGIFLHCVRDQFLTRWKNASAPTGLLNGAGQPHHWAYQAAETFRMMKVQIVDESSYQIIKDPNFTPDSELVFRYELTRDGMVIENGIAQNTDQADLISIIPHNDMVKPGRYHLSVISKTAKGTVLGKDQWLISEVKSIPDRFPGGTIRNDGNKIVLKAADCLYTIDRSSGNLEQIQIGSQLLLSTPLVPVFLKENALGEGNRSVVQLNDEWERLGKKRHLPKPVSIEVDHMDHAVFIRHNIAGGLLRTYRINTDGALDIEMRLRTGKNPPYKIGMQCGLVPELEEATWFGRGPWDCYPDRKDAGFIALHNQFIAEQDRFPLGGETGNKMDVYFITLSAKDDLKLNITGAAPMQTVLRAALPGDRASATTLELIGYRAPLGCSGAPCCESANIQPQTTYQFQFTIQPQR